MRGLALREPLGERLVARISSPAGMPWNELESRMSTDTAAELLALIRSDSASMTLVAIDGHSAAGKSTMARILQTKHSDAAVVQTDDFYRPLDPGYRATLDAAGGYA